MGSVAGSYATKSDACTKWHGWAIQLSRMYSIVAIHLNVCDPWEIVAITQSDYYFATKANGKV